MAEEERLVLDPEEVRDALAASFPVPTAIDLFSFWTKNLMTVVYEDGQYCFRMSEEQADTISRLLG